MYPNSIDGPVVVIGDVHGDYDQVKNLLEQFVKNGTLKDRWVVFIGDYIDTGPHTAQTIELLINFAKFHEKTTFCCGNHDLNLIKALNLIPNPHQEYYWGRIPKRNKETLASYKARTAEELQEKMPAAHKEFLKNLTWCVEHPRFCFVHCGLDPGEPYDSQITQLKKQDQTIFKPKWLHEDALAYQPVPKDMKKTLVTGHMILQNVSAAPQKILIDTGAGYGGLLSAVTLPECQIFTGR